MGRSILPVLLALVTLLTTACGTRSSNSDHGGPVPALTSHLKSILGTPDAGAAVRAENAKPGTTDWKLGATGPQEAIEGFADAVSVRPGGPFQLFVSTTAREFTVVAYRMGWYGGAQAREVWRSDRLPGRRQAAPQVSPGLHTATAAWEPSATVETTGWPEGNYLLKLVSDAGFSRYVPLTVRSGDTRGRVVILNAVTTWQAYNAWGGHSLYRGPTGFADRARAVSFDRPYAGIGADKYLTYEQPLVKLAEKLGLPLAYATDLELHEEPGLFTDARAVITLGHDEYWSSAMREHATTIRDAGTNLAFLGANAVNRHIRLEKTALGKNRLVVCYKSAAEDPMYGVDPHETTQDWRLPPHPRPENVLTGTYYQCNPATAPFVVHDPGAWMFAGTGVRRGTSFPGLVGPEYDRVVADSTTPRPIQVLSHSPITCHGKADYANAAYYTAPSGAGVFASGTMYWVCALGTGCGRSGLEATGRRFATRVTENVLRVFAAGPAGRTHPARDNTAEAGVRP